MRRRYVDQTDDALGKTIDPDSVFINRHGYHLGPVAFKRRERPAVAWIFDCDRRSRFDEQPSDDVESLLYSIHDDDLRSANIHAAGRAQMLRNGVPEFEEAGGMLIFGKR